MALQAEGVRHRLEPPGEHPAWRVWVKVDEAIEGRRVLTEFERENTPIATPRVEAELSTWNVGLFFAVLCIVVQLATGPRDPHLAWFAKGSADAALIVAGQWWRALCALTLHADLGHAFGNAAAGWLLMEAVARRLGPGRTSALTLLAGLVGNLLTAQVMRRSFESIGASTAVFGVLGAATVLQAFLRVRRGWIVVGAGVALLGTLGTGEHADLFGHLFGFSSGALLGLAQVPFARRPKAREWVDVLLVIAVLTAIAGAWMVALRS